MTKQNKISFYSLKSSTKKKGLPVALRKTFEIYKVEDEMKQTYTPTERAQGIHILTELSMETYINFMGGTKNGL